MRTISICASMATVVQLHPTYELLAVSALRVMLDRMPIDLVGDFAATLCSNRHRSRPL